jgi:hypothetical protein
VPSREKRNVPLRAYFTRGAQEIKAVIHAALRITLKKWEMGSGLENLKIMGNEGSVASAARILHEENSIFQDLTPRSR